MPNNNAVGNNAPMNAESFFNIEQFDNIDGYSYFQ